MTATTFDTVGWVVDHPVITVTRAPFTALQGHDPRGMYAEFYWLPIVGPSALWMYRRLVGRCVVGADDGFDVDLAVLAAELGLGRGINRNSPVVRTLERLIRFGLVYQAGDRLEISMRVPPLPQRFATRLPAHLQTSFAKAG